MKDFFFVDWRPTIAQATVLPPADWLALSVTDMDIAEAELERAAKVWLWLVGVAADSPEAERVRREVASDAPLLCALSLPTVEFLRWFRAEAWEAFDSTERTGGEAWAMGVMRRAWGACEAFGPLAAQRSLVVLP